MYDVDDIFYCRFIIVFELDSEKDRFIRLFEFCLPSFKRLLMSSDCGIVLVVSTYIFAVNTSNFDE